jgi:hypothetical protein
MIVRCQNETYVIHRSRKIYFHETICNYVKRTIGKHAGVHWIAANQWHVRISYVMSRQYRIRLNSVSIIQYDRQSNVSIHRWSIRKSTWQQMSTSIWHSFYSLLALLAMAYRWLFVYVSIIIYFFFADGTFSIYLLSYFVIRTSTDKTYAINRSIYVVCMCSLLRMLVTYVHGN